MTSSWRGLISHRSILTDKRVSLWRRAFPPEQIWRCGAGPRWRTSSVRGDTEKKKKKRWPISLRCRFLKNQRFLARVYEGWSFCRAEMSRGGGARPLHSLSCPSLKRRLREGRGTPDSAGGWLRGLDTPLSMSDCWKQSCQQRAKVTDQNTKQGGWQYKDKLLWEEKVGQRLVQRSTFDVHFVWSSYDILSLKYTDAYRCPTLSQILAFELSADNTWHGFSVLLPKAGCSHDFQTEYVLVRPPNSLSQSISD